MITHIFVLLLAAFLALEVSSTKIKSIRTKPSNIEPRDLIDEAEVQLGELKDTVVGAISAAENNLGALESDFYAYGEEILETGSIAIQQEYQTIMEKLKVIVDLGESAGVDTLPCTTVRDEVIGKWVTLYSDEIRSCIATKNTQTYQVLQDARYFVDVYINKVNELEFQLGLCTTDSDLCISPIVTQMESGMVQLPQEIQVEVDQVTELLGNLKPLVQICSDAKVDEYEFDGNALLGNIEYCINQLLP